MMAKYDHEYEYKFYKQLIRTYDDGKTENPQKSIEAYGIIKNLMIDKLNIYYLKKLYYNFK